MVLFIIGNVLLVYNHAHTIGILFLFMHFFAAGLLLADLYINQTIIFNNKWKIGGIIGWAALISLLFVGSIQNLGGYFIKLTSIFFLIHSVLTHEGFKKMFSIPLVTVIGGMCYSIYLVHFAIISALGKIMFKYSLISGNRIFFLPYIFLFCITIVIVSAIFFKLIEKPFMKLGRFKRTSV